MVAKGKHGKVVLKKSKVKAKRWKKGHSSSSNPDTKRFREAAKGRFFQHNIGSSDLTVTALAKHDESHTDADGDAILSEMDRQSTAGMTFSTWATGWTDCTNATFGRVHRYWSSNSAVHREILAVLAAVTEVIKTQGGKETETEYFGALSTALETCDSEQSLAAVAYLLSLVIKRVPTSVLRSRFSEIAKKYLDLLGQYSSTSATALLKSLLLCLSYLLRVQESALWSSASTQQVYTGLLTFIAHHKPKVRKAAHQAVCIVLKGSLFMSQGEPPTHHPAASLTAKYCIQQIEDTGGGDDATKTLYVLTLLRDIVFLFPHHGVKTVCETVLRLMTLGSVMMTAGCMQALNALMTANAKPTSLSVELNAQIMTALYDYQPSLNDVQPMQAWLTVMEKSHANLSRLDNKLCLSHLPRLISVAMKALLSNKEDVQQFSATAIKSLIEQCITPVPETLEGLISSTPEGSTSSIHKIVNTLESGFGYQYHSSWKHVLEVFAVLYKSIGKQCQKILRKSLLLMAELRESTKFPYKAEVDHAVGCAIGTMGPRCVLEAMPLLITGENDDTNFPRSWLLPLLRDNIAETELGFFNSYFLPLAAKLRHSGLQNKADGNKVLASSYDALQWQIWSLLPGFCTRPTDLLQSFKGIGRVLGSAISDQEDLRMEVMASLRKLIMHSMNDEKSKQEVAKFSKNFLPILFNVFTAETENAKDTRRLAALETVKCYLQITDKKLIATFFDKSVEKTEDQSITDFRRYALYDLCHAMLPYVDGARLEKLYGLATENLQNEDRTLQKKSYRLVEEFCTGKSPELIKFLNERLPRLQTTLLESLSLSNPSSKAPRVRCLINIFRHLDTNQEEFLVAVVSEAILCTKEVAERARQAAYTLLVEMGNAMARWHPDAKSAAMEKYFNVILAGLGGSPHMIGATLLALTRILFAFKDAVSNDLLDTLVDTVCVLLSAKSREVVQSVLAFLKVLLAAYTETRLACYLKKIVSSIISMKEDGKHHFRFKTKEIFARLIRKFGYETIYRMTPVSMQKVLANIRKTQESAKRKKKAKEENANEPEEKEYFTRPESIDELLRDTDSELDDDDTKNKKGKQNMQKGKKKAGGKAWLEEAGEDIIDFLDPGTSKKVIATQPVKKSESKSKEPVFKTSSDGRLIITGDSDEEADTGLAAGDADELQELLDAFKGGHKSAKGGKKRKLDVTDDMEEEGAKPAKYKAGGSGIHRPLNKDGGSKLGAEYKAKKAGGDIKKKGLPDPYAYVPLDYRQLNRRKQAKMKGQFSNFVKGAKKGAAKGMKRKSRKN